VYEIEDVALWCILIMSILPMTRLYVFVERCLLDELRGLLWSWDVSGVSLFSMHSVLGLSQSQRELSAEGVAHDGEDSLGSAQLLRHPTHFSSQQLRLCVFW